MYCGGAARNLTGKGNPTENSDVIEFAARLILSGLIPLLAGLAGTPDFGLAWKAALAVSLYSALGYRLELKGMKNSGIAGFVAIGDALIIALLVGSAGGLATAGFLVLLPCLYARAVYGANAIAMAPIAAAWLLASDAVFNRVQMSPGLMVQAGGVMLCALILGRARPVGTRDRIGSVEAAPVEIHENDRASTAYLELRENYRQVRTRYRDLELRSRREHLLVELMEAKLGDGEPFFRRLALKLQDLISADSVALYTLARLDEMMVVRGIAGAYPESMQKVSHRVDLQKAPGQIRHDVHKAVEALRTTENKAHFANVLLMDRGRIVGMACVFHGHALDLDDVRERMEELAPMVAAMIREEDKREARERRLRETELLYDIAVTAAGAESSANIAARVVREIGSVVDADHFGIFLIDGSELLAVAHGGIPVRLIEKMRFPAGEGLQGWLDSGSPEIVMSDALNDEHLPRAEAIKRRIHSYCIIPLQYGETPCGFLAAGSQRAGGLDQPDLASLRTIASEMSQAFARTRERVVSGTGLVTPREFQRLLKEATTGCLVYLEPLRKDSLVEVYGAPAIEIALRKLGRRLGSRLPYGGAICRRAEGDYVALLPGTEAHASAWANDAAATASMIGLTTPDGSAKIPLALRAKVAPVNTPNLPEELVV